MKMLTRVIAVVSVAALPLIAAAEGVQVAEAKLGKGVQDRQITDESTSFAVNDKVYLWLKLTGGPSDPVKVDWKIGDFTDSVSLKVGGSPWRTWSSKTAFKAGEWTVTVSDAGGNTLKEMKFTVQ
ncbi:MAG TPA: DUF2914 domain-containing protein [Burkholderiales bacterium]|nr:DUF2914 domain-containing protein [Burkholderiales bacterium]